MLARMNQLPDRTDRTAEPTLCDATPNARGASVRCLPCCEHSKGRDCTDSVRTTSWLLRRRHVLCATCTLAGLGHTRGGGGWTVELLVLCARSPTVLHTTTAGSFVQSYFARCNVQGPSRLHGAPPAPPAAAVDERDAGGRVSIQQGAGQPPRPVAQQSRRATAVERSAPDGDRAPLLARRLRGGRDGTGEVLPEPCVLWLTN